MNRYMLFIGHNYYASGGWLDWQGSYDDLAEATRRGNAFVAKSNADWWHVVDSHDGTVVARQEGAYCG